MENKIERFVDILEEVLCGRLDLAYLRNSESELSHEDALDVINAFIKRREKEAIEVQKDYDAVCLIIEEDKRLIGEAEPGSKEQLELMKIQSRHEELKQSNYNRLQVAIGVYNNAKESSAELADSMLDGLNDAYEFLSALFGNTGSILNHLDDDSKRLYLKMIDIKREIQRKNALTIIDEEPEA